MSVKLTSSDFNGIKFNYIMLKEAYGNCIFLLITSWKFQVEIWGFDLY